MTTGEFFFSRFIAIVDAPLCVVDRAGAIRSATAAFGQLAGASPRSLEGTPLGSLLPSADAALLRSHLTQPDLVDLPIASSLGESSRPVRLRVVCADPISGLTLIAATSVGDDQPALQSNRKLLELTAILQNASVGIIFTKDRVIQRCNSRMAEIFRYAEPEDLVGKPALELYPDAESYERIGREAGPLLGASQSFQTEVQCRRADGTLVWCKLYGKAVDPSRTADGTVWIVEDITATKQTQDELQRMLRKTKAIMQNAPVGLFFTRDRRITDYNPQLARMVGIEGDRGIGMPARAFYRSDEEYAALGRVAGPLLSQGQPFQTECYLRRLDGTEFWAHLIAYVQDQKDSQGGTIWIIEDRTAFKRAEEEIRRVHAELLVAKERAEVANEAKNLFLAKMSHDLRTPLTAILGYADILKRRKDLYELEAVGLNAIEQSGEHLLTLVNDILDVSKIEANKLGLYPVPVDLPAFVRDIVHVVRVRAERKGLLLACETHALPPSVSADGKRLRQVLLNLLGNALEYTAKGQVVLRVQRRPEGDGSVRVHFEVEDTGVGIHQDQLGLLFQPFVQVGDVQRRASGTGLGLAISQQLVRLMGGEIQVQSELGRGSRFHFELCLSMLETVPAVAPEGRVVGYQGPRKKLLVVDDVAQNRAMLIDMLLPLGFEVYTAGDGSEGLAKANELRPDAILMDNTMPVMGGREAMRRLRALEPLKDVPIIAISASASQADREKTMAAGASGFLAKPIRESQLLALLETHLGLHFLRATAGEGPAASSRRSSAKI